MCPLGPHLLHLVHDPSHVLQTLGRLLVQLIEGGNRGRDVLYWLGQELQVLDVELHCSVEGEIGLRSHGVSLVILLSLLLQLSYDWSRSGSYNGNKLLLPHLLLLQHGLYLLKAGLGVSGDTGQLGHGLLQL